jgi:hypothetical protein
MEHAAVPTRETGPKPHLPTVQALGRIAVPGSDGIEIIEFGHAPARGREMASRLAMILRQLRHMKNISEEHPMFVKFTGEDPSPKAGESVRFVNLISIHTENPCRRTREVPDEGMGFSRMPDGSVANLRQLASQSAQNDRRSVDRAMIGHVYFITKIRDVLECSFDKDVLVADKDDSNNA